jgi:predicted small lipoprotein YifL
MRLPALLALALLAACGAEDPPFFPSASVGVGVDGDGDAGAGASFGLSNGTVSLGVGL